MKNKKLYLQLLAAVITMAFIASCHKTDISSSAPADNTSILSIIQNYLAFSKTKVDGTFMFESNVANNDNSIKNTALVGGLFYDKSGNAVIGNGSVSIGDNQLVANSSGTYGFDKILSRDGLFGANVKFTLSPPNNSGGAARPDSTISGNVYSPAAIQITNIAPKTPLIIQPNTTTPITWNIDPNNKNGVIIIAEYLPTLYANKTALSNGYKSFLTNSVLVPDNGSTVLPTDFFSQYPTGGQIILWVARGNYTILSSGLYSYKVGGYTAAAVWDVTIPCQPPAAPTSITNMASGKQFTSGNTYSFSSIGTSWSVTGATIVSGQGTNTITVNMSFPINNIAPGGGTNPPPTLTPFSISVKQITACGSSAYFTQTGYVAH